ncbi:carboxylesterase family protein [Bacillus sp. FJAT-49705]|uniref:Carboxylic ester hydrolase n=1 Tax=Cytobacillus citreus TaxID=2833586 RepID=A0ABS5NWX5_9BACI|nr:carboxylesterase family protein [Cytobacillus citreus]MBS4192347.1 carboxylesterase family protein [Cytobacillus citreus]
MQIKERPLMETMAGWIEGIRLAKVDKYLGIPYAAPPVGELRWKKPQDVEPWEGVLEVKAFKEPSAQSGTIYGTPDTSMYGKLVGSEDSLYLNVWTPVRDASDKRPVLVFIHGGSNTRGTASDPIYEASRIAEEANVVVVTVNYRLGFLGAFYHQALHTGDAANDSGNYVTLDLIKGLEWVQRNIGNFGGDAGNVTIQGHSAGCMNVWGLIHSQMATGLFHKAIAMSGYPQLRSIEKAEEAAEALITVLLLQDGLIDSSKLAEQYKRSMGAEGIRQYLLGQTTDKLIKAGAGVKQISHICDGIVLPFGNEKELQVANAVPMMIGTVLNEASLLLVYGYKGQKELWELFNHNEKNFNRRDFLKNPSYLSYKLKCTLFNKSLFYWFDNKLMRRIADIPKPIYQYKFTWDQLPLPWRKIFGTFHGLDVIFTFGNFLSDVPNLGRFVWSKDNEESRELLHSEIVSSIKGFIETGDPNLYRQNSEVWQTISSDSRNFVVWK